MAVPLQRNQASRPRPLRIGFILTPRFTLLPFAALVDALRLAADDGDQSRQINCSWSVIAPTLDPIPASCGIRVSPTEIFCDPELFDYIIVISGLLSSFPDDRILAYLRRADRARVPLIGVGTGTFTLLRAGVLKGRKCCVSWYHCEDLVSEFPDAIPIADQLFVVDGRYITCAGGAVAIDLASWLINRHLGPAYAQKSLHIMIVDRARPGTSPQPQPPLTRATENPRVRRAILLIEQNLSRPLSIADIARQLHVSKRHLERLFRKHVGVSLQAFARKLRLDYGMWRLVSSKDTISEIADNCGFSDASHFIRCFRLQYGRSPSEMRKTGQTEMLTRLRHSQFSEVQLADLTVGSSSETLLSERRPYIRLSLV